MHKRQAILTILIAVSVALGAAVYLYGRGSNPDEGSPGGVSSDQAVALNSVVLSGNSGSVVDFDPDRGIWPGLPSIASSELSSDWRPPDFDGPASDAMSSDAVDQSVTQSAPLLELIEDFDDLPPERRGRVALQIAEGWRECMFYRPGPDEEIDERVERRFRSSRDFATSILAQVPEGPLVDEAVEEMAKVDPDQVRAGIREDVLGKRHLCDGSEDIDWRERMGKELIWLRKAARLGSYSAQHAFLDKVFMNTRPSGQAAQLAEDKRLVLDIIAARLQSRDLLVLERLARFVSEGYFGPPDPLLGHAYAQAAILAAERLAQTEWYLKNSEPERVQQYIVMVGFNTRGLRQALTASELAEAEDIARKIARLERQP